MTPESTPWIWNRGLALLCDHRFPGLCSRATRHARHAWRIDYEHFDAGKIGDGDAVWVDVHWLEDFARSVLPSLEKNIHLLSGDGDQSVPSSLPGTMEIILDNDRILSWHTQNFDATTTDSRMHPLPIGMDFHTLAAGAAWGMPRLAVAEQARNLESVRAALKPTHDRALALYIDSEFRCRADPFRPGAANALTRRDVVARLQVKPVVHVEATRLPQIDLWRRRGEYMFVLSHHGNGLDCHRTWEALALGHIVVMQHSTLDPLFRELPVFFVEDWGAIDRSLLERWRSEFIRTRYDYRRLTSAFWMEEITGSPARRSTPAVAKPGQQP